jgi:hypothetical protein
LRLDYVAAQHCPKSAESKAIIAPIDGAALTANPRFNMAPDAASVILALRACHHAVIGVQSKVHVNGPVYHSASMVMAAIDAMATLLTRDQEYLWARGSTMTGQERQAKARRDAIDRDEKSAPG